MIGQLVGRFRIVAKLGEGGMGSVWRADDPLLGRSVALKFLSAEMETFPEARRHFIHEARATSALDHPGLARVYDAGEYKGRLFIAIAYIEGRTICDIVAAGPLALAEAVRLTAEAAEALEYAHVRGIIHRDISARNLMRSNDGRAIVIDFGVAALRDTTAPTSAGTAVGTMAYTSPEVLCGGCASRLSDLYGLGVVLYEMVTGRLPFSGDQPAALVYSIVNQRPAPPRAARPEVSTSLQRLILRLLAKDPSQRYPSAAELAAALRGLRPESTPSRRASRPPPAPQPPARRRTGAGELPDRKLLAVLPFHSLSDGEPQLGASELALGLAETLSASLARVPNLQIIPPGQLPIPGASVEASAAALKHGATLILQGTVHRSGERLRLTYSLIETRHGVQLAGDRLDGVMGDLIAVEDALTSSVLRALRVRAIGSRRVHALDAAAHEHYLRALGHLQRRDSEDEIDHAIELLEGLVESEGDTAPVHAALARAYLRKSAITYRAEWRARAETSCRTALGLDPHSPEVLVILAKLELQAGRTDEALAAIKLSLSLQGQNIDAQFCLVQALESSGRFEEAEREALAAVAARPEYWLTYERLALVYFRWGRFTQAAEQWEKVVEMVPDHQLASANLGATYFHLGRLGDAAVACRRALEIRPQASAYISLGTVLFFDGQREAALEMFEQAARLRPDDPRVWTNLADAQRWSTGQESESARSLEQAELLLRKQLAMSRDDPDALSQLAKVLSKRNRPAEAREAIERALGLAPGAVSSLARAVTVFHLVGDHERAVHYLRAALQAGYSSVELCLDPELQNLHRSPEAQVIFTEGLATWSGMPTQPIPGGR
jgi:serine/threonine-protein kinase